MRIKTDCIIIKAIFFDIDGTLVSFKTHRIPQSTIDAIVQAKMQGIKIYISTGRPFPLINNIDGIKHLVDGYITANGAYCFVGNKVISCQCVCRPHIPSDAGCQQFADGCPDRACPPAAYPTTHSGDSER